MDYELIANYLFKDFFPQKGDKELALFVKLSISFTNVSILTVRCHEILLFKTSLQIFFRNLHFSELLLSQTSFLIVIGLSIL